MDHRYVSLRATTPASSPARQCVPTTDLVGRARPRYSAWLQGRIWISILIALSVAVAAFLAFFFAPRSVELSTVQMNMEMFKFHTKTPSISTRIVSKLSVSNPNFVQAQVHSIVITMVYLCKECRNADGLNLGERSVVTDTVFPPRTLSATLPWTLNFESTFVDASRYADFQRDFNSNCTRDGIYFIHPTCLADVSYLGMRRNVSFPAPRTRIICDDPVPPDAI